MYWRNSMKQLLIIPDVNDMRTTMSLSEEYKLGFEYNDFFEPAVLDDKGKTEQLLKQYEITQAILPYCSMHGAFYDVIPCSLDSRIKEVSRLRIEQSIKMAKKLGVAAVVFHTNYNPFLNTTAYTDTWVEQNAKYWSYVLEQHSDISIYLENMFESSPDMLEELSKALSTYQNYGVCLDYGHAAISKTEPMDWAKRLGRFVKHVHINDNDLTSDLHLAWGDGKIDRKGFYRSYENYFGDATVLIETRGIESQQRSLKKLKEEGFF